MWSLLTSNYANLSSRSQYHPVRVQLSAAAPAVNEVDGQVREMLVSVTAPRRMNR